MESEGKRPLQVLNELGEDFPRDLMKYKVPIFLYHSLIDYLKTCYALENLNSKETNYQTFSTKLGLKSKSHLSIILNGQKLVSKKLSQKLTNFFELGNLEAEYFNCLWELSRAKSLEEKSIIQDNIHHILSQSNSASALELNRYHFFSKWHIPVVLKLVTMRK